MERRVQMITIVFKLWRHLRRVAICAVTISASATAGGVPPLSDVLNKVSQSVVKVVGQKCLQVQEQSGTGFLWPRSDTVVTAMHLVASCKTVSIVYEHLPRDRGRGTRSAHLAQVLKRSDLALLKVENAPQLPSLATTDESPKVNEQLWAVGYYLDTPHLSGTGLTVRYGGPRLKDIVPSNLARSLAHFASPDPDIDILSLEGHLLPGHSGAPVVDRRGRVVGVANGGLESGAASVSWSIPVAHLNQLAKSTESDGPGPYPTGLFSAEIQQSAHKRISCGFEFVSIKRRRFVDIARSMGATDDPDGLQSLLRAMVTDYGLNIDEEEYDIYENAESGATIVIPSDATLESVGGKICRARVLTDDYDLTFNVHVGRLNVGEILDSRIAEFERAILPDKDTWHLRTFAGSMRRIADPERKITRFDGLTVVRRGWERDREVEGTVLEDEVIETLATRNDFFLGGSCAIIPRRSANPQALREWNRCTQTPLQPNCTHVISGLRTPARLLIAAWLTTFGIG
jgi:S1-C subfamily serine protease